VNKAMYTSFGFGNINSGGCNHHFKNAEFLNIQRKKIPEYCARHNIPLRVIGYDHKYMIQILSNFDPDVKFEEKRHSIYTLSALAAIFDFCESPFDEFYWMHLDMVFNKPEINIFDTFEIDDDVVYNWEFCHMDTYGCDDWQHQKFKMRRLLMAYFNIPYDPNDIRLHYFSNCSTIMMTKTTALKFKEAILEHMNFFDTKIDCLYSIEETFMEVVSYLRSDLSFRNIGSVKTINEYKDKLFPITFKPVWGDPDLGDHSNAVFIHYWGKNKDDIEKFYRDRGDL
jgi:hypothetical protein